MELQHILDEEDDIISAPFQPFKSDALTFSRPEEYMEIRILTWNGI